MIAVTFMKKIQEPQGDGSWIVEECGACFPQSVVIGFNLKTKTLFCGGEWAIRRTGGIIHLDSPEHGSIGMLASLISQIDHFAFQNRLFQLGKR